MNLVDQLVDADPETIRAALKEHGREAAIAWLQTRGFDPDNLYTTDEAPEEAPFTDREGTPAEIVRATFAPVAEDLPKLVERLAESVYAVFRYQTKGQWLTLYVCDEPEGPVVFAGGPPNPTPEVPEEHAELEWTVPDELARLYAVHDGLGWLDTATSFWWKRTVLPSAALMPATIFTHFGADMPYDAGHLLLFWSDAAGVFQALIRTDADDPRPLAGTWSSVDQELPDDLTPVLEWIDAHIGPGVDG